jgi:hypothetical protein
MTDDQIAEGRRRASAFVAKKTAFLDNPEAIEAM